MPSSIAEKWTNNTQLQLETIRRTLHLFYWALSGRNSLIASYQEIATKSQLDRGSIVRLPGIERPSWYRVALAHRAMHEELGTMRFSLDRPGTLSAGLRSRVVLPTRLPSESDLETILRSFDEPQTALDCFVLLEDLRVDTAVKRRYPGLRGDLERVQREELLQRAPLEGLSARATLFEALARISLGWRGSIAVPRSLVPATQELAITATRITAPEATVEDVIDATIQIYPLFTQPRQLATPRTSDFDPSLVVIFGIDGRQGPVRNRPLEPIRYRDAVGARIFSPSESLRLDEEASFEDVLRASILGGEPIELTGPGRPGLMDLGDKTVPESDGADSEGDESKLEFTSDLKSFVYPEWDYRAGRYREAWCRVTEMQAPSSESTELYRTTLRTHRKLLAEIRRQFERITPETLQRIRRVREGEDLDIDACIEAFADLRAGVPPSDDLYQTRQRVQRDVAVIFLLDLSNSTQELVIRGGSLRRIIDVARESLILLVAPLARLGDLFGIYGFSGTGRRDVRFIVIKDINERLTNDVLERLGSLRAYQTTRMGAAIRHATTKLKGHPAGTRLLILISDGRPFDVDYGQEYGPGEEIEYAINDTRTALDETRSQGIRPFLITVDPEGADYLRRMCNGLDYELLENVAELPARLAGLYQQLTPISRRSASHGLRIPR